jgi:hypothetical protein
MGVYESGRGMSSYSLSRTKTPQLPLQELY